MKKLIKAIIIGILFISLPNMVNAYEYETTTNIEDISPSIKLHVKTNEKEFDITMQKITENKNHKHLYTLNYEKTLTNENIKIDGTNWSQLPGETKQALYDIVHYGYGYQNHTDEKWYVVTQYLLWDYLLKVKGEIYFINDFNEKIDVYKKEQEELLNLIEAKKVFPSFMDEKYKYINASIDDKLTFVDTNYVLEDCNIIANNIEYKFEGNKLNIFNVNLGENPIIIERKEQNENEEDILVYENQSSDIFMMQGAKRIEGRTINIVIDYPKVNLKLSNKYQMSTQGLKYQLENLTSGMPYEIIELDEKGETSIIIREPGKYVLKEIEVPNGYEKTEEEINIEIKKHNVDVEVNPKLMTKKITINTFIGDESNNTLDKNVAYNLTKNDMFIEKIISDSSGKVVLNLPLGNYKITQIKGNSSFTLGEKEIVVADFTGEETIDIINNKKKIASSLSSISKNTSSKNDFEESENSLKETPNNTGSLLIEKLNPYTNEPITNYELGLYDENKNLIKEFVTDNEYGRAKINDLPAGTYYIRELSDYSKELKGDLKVIVEPGKETNITIGTRTLIDVPITGINELSKGKILSMLLLSIGLFINVYKKS